MNSTCIVLKAAAYRDSDRMLTLFSLERGRLSALARGARKPSGKLKAACEPMFCGVFAFNQSGERLYITQAMPKISFSRIPQCYEAYLSAMLFLEAADIFLTSEPDARLFALLINCLNHLNGGADPFSIAAYFLIRLCEIAGVGLSLNNCARCGKPVNPEFLSVTEGGAVCESCRAPAAPPAPPLFIEAVRSARALSPKKAAMFKIDEKIRRFTLNFLLDYVECMSDSRLKCEELRKLC